MPDLPPGVLRPGWFSIKSGEFRYQRFDAEGAHYAAQDRLWAGERALRRRRRHDQARA